MGPPLEQPLLGLVDGHAVGCHQPADGDRRAASPSRLAVDIHLAAVGHLLFDETNALADAFKRGRSEVDRGDMQLLDSGLLVLPQRPVVFLAGVHNRGDSQFCQAGNVTGKGPGSQDHVVVNRIPPVPDSEQTSEQQVPGQRGIEDEVGKEPFHAGSDQGVEVEISRSAAIQDSRGIDYNGGRNPDCPSA